VRIAYVYQAYSDSLRATAEAHPDHTTWEWQRYKGHLDSVNYYYHGYELSHSALGHACVTVPLNALDYLRSWARHLGIDPIGTSEDLTVRLVAYAQPEVLMASPNHLRLLRRLRAEVPSLRLLLVPANAPGIDSIVFGEADGVVTCIPEVAQRLSSQGLRAVHLHHGFATHVLDQVPTQTKSPARELLFLGGIFRGADFHLERERLLLTLARQVPLTLLSPAYSALNSDAQRRLWLRRLGYVATYPARWVPSLRRALAAAPLVGEALALPEFPPDLVHPELAPRLRPAVYGLEMFARLRQSQVVLNTHIDLSPVSASNVRMFESTGIGVCLLTDAKSNLSSLFEPDREVVAYTDAPDCAERAQWLLERPEVCAEMGQRAQARVLREHTQQQRVEAFTALVNRWMP